MPWTDQQKALWEIAKGKLQGLNNAMSKHEGARSGEVPTANPDAYCHGERWAMLQMAQSLSFDLACLLKLEDEQRNAP